ncbi:unnamed protein product [Periconia digitata]|uniref:Uncharacterized protein n=1 Tax=Periconia digitata TaxID=1303443 RepID=A0A9W4XUP2_9PLEO|nr:unnamed protein product [Periconia digitata]
MGSGTAPNVGEGTVLEKRDYHVVLTKPHVTSQRTRGETRGIPSAQGHLYSTRDVTTFIARTHIKEF